MKNPIKNYKFWIKIISAALLIALGLWILFDSTIAKQLVLIVTALVFSIFAIIRFVPLMKTLGNNKSRIFIIVQTLIHLVLAVYLFIAATKLTSDPDSSFSNFNNEYYRFFIAFYLYSTAVVYFICTILYKEETDKIKFWIHILLITLACLICAFSNLTMQALAIALVVLAFLCALILIVDSGYGYSRYRKTVVKSREKGKAKKEDVVELPADSITPITEDKPTDTAQIC